MKKQPLSEFSNARVLVAPSMLASDFSALGMELQRIEDASADIVHLDVMDAHFVPNLTIGPALIASLRKHSRLPFDVHLMMTNPLKYIKAFADAGADNITFHIECDDPVTKVISAIRAAGCSVGITMKPGTPASSIQKVVSKVNMVLIMTVEPGFGGQSFMQQTVSKITEVRRMLNASNPKAHVEVDGGIDESNANEVVAAGANVLVAGTSVFKHQNGIAAAIEQLHATQKQLNTGITG